MAVTKVRQRLAEIKRKRDLAASRLNGQVEQLEFGVKLIEDALQLLSNAADMYLRMPPEGRQKMNQAVFEKLYVFDGEVTAVVFNPPFGDLLGAQEIGKRSPTYERRAALPVFDWSLSQADPENLSEPLAEVLFGDGLSKGLMVEVLGRYSNHCDQGKRIERVLEIPLSAPTTPVSKPPRKVHRRLLARELDELADAYVAGATLSQLSERFRKHRSTISTDLERRGVSRRYRLVEGERLHLAIQSYQAGKSVVSIGKDDLGVAGETVRQALIQAGVELRPRRGWEQ